MAMREDETVAQAMGINTLYYKLMAFATGAAFAGLGGALFAARNQYTGPADHTLMVSINVLSLVDRWRYGQYSWCDRWSLCS